MKSGDQAKPLASGRAFPPPAPRQESAAVRREHVVPQGERHCGDVRHVTDKGVIVPVRARGRSAGSTELRRQPLDAHIKHSFRLRRSLSGLRASAYARSWTSHVVQDVKTAARVGAPLLERIKPGRLQIAATIVNDEGLGSGEGNAMQDERCSAAARARGWQTRFSAWMILLGGWRGRNLALIGC